MAVFLAEYAELRARNSFEGGEESAGSSCELLSVNYM